jgi:hypothetical protein
MTSAVLPDSTSALGSEFNEFLFAPIGEDRNGMRLSVLSALARMDIDPWQEAAKLARLPEDAAAEKLTSLITAQHGVPSVSPDFARIAPRLIALLPRQPDPKIAPRKGLMGSDIALGSPALIIVVYLIFTAFMLSAQWIAASRQVSPQNENAPAAASAAIVPPVQTPLSGQ